MTDSQNGSGIKFSYVVTVVCVLAIVFAGTAFGKWMKAGCEIGELFRKCPAALVNPSGTVGPRAPGATYDYVVEARAAYLRAADGACQRWTSQGPTGEAPRSHSGFAAWLRKVISLRRGMVGAWRTVATPQAIYDQIQVIFLAAADALDALIDAYNRFIGDDTSAYRYAVATYQRVNADATQQARNYGFGACGYIWANLY
jgi:hypothetical protein